LAQAPRTVACRIDPKGFVPHVSLFFFVDWIESHKKLMRAVDRHSAKKEGPEWSSVHVLKDGPKSTPSNYKNAPPERYEKRGLNVKGVEFRVFVLWHTFRFLVYCAHKSGTN